MTAMPPTVRLAVLTTHPIQYAAPLYRRLSAEPDIDLTVFFASDISVRSFVDPGFGREIQWDVPLLEGYRSEFLPAWGRTDQLSWWRPWSRGLGARLRAGRFDRLMIHGYSRPAHWAATAAARAAGVRVLIRDEATPISRRRGPIKRLLKRLFFAILDQAVDGFLTIGSLNAAYYRQVGIAPERMFLTPYAVDNAFFRNTPPGAGVDLRRRLGVPDGAPAILYAAKLERRKHPDHLLEAFKRLDATASPHPPHLLIAGDGELMTELRAAAAGRGDVHFLGFQGQHDLLACYAACDVFVLPSSCEPWGLAVNEAMNAGKAIILSDQVGCGPDLLKPGENGLIFPTGDIAALARALETICRDPALTRAMGRRSLEIVSAWDFEADVRGFRRALGLPPSSSS
jgi:glycosyltransferase involved in cell wall biosynthesis